MKLLMGGFTGTTENLLLQALKAIQTVKLALNFIDRFPRQPCQLKW